MNLNVIKLKQVSVEYKAVRVIIYEGTDVTAPAQEKMVIKGI